MISSTFHFGRLLAAWLVVYIAFCIFLVESIFEHTEFGERDLGGYFVLLGFVLGLWVLSGVFSHIRRVRLVSGAVNSSTLSNRQRRQIEIPFEAGEAFDLIDAAIRELPGAVISESARDSLQVRAKVARIDPYGNSERGEGRVSNWALDHFGSRRNQILATVTPNGDEAGSVTLICEPEGAAWTDWFLVDHGTNLENAEAIVRAITRRVAERRRGEKARVRQTATEKELTVAKLNLLHAQVEPHFLYNTLASAQVLTRTDPARADEMLGNLIQYLRHSLPRTEDAPSTIGEELERARAYLDILKIRMGPRLQLQVDIPDALRGVLFPTMMLQTLVENAIKHGLEPKPGGGTVWILARQVDNAVAVTVADDGRGFTAEGGGTGVGLRNVRERLRLAYGSAASFSIVANFPSGVAATITVPNAVNSTVPEGVHHA
ncbi:sensor histidine kinase [Telluria aromaticivorans]|uniref:Histidine kinase n=1 Tax=Telluria aromaticivorans TaxID=2725995 RepID=A0A7Y2K0S0_9BURK|nr:histidine kinase [Telluria aromaticivorans]NNG23299.1 histidine kinase [Telluria aromaticivorans]